MIGTVIVNDSGYVYLYHIGKGGVWKFSLRVTWARG